MKRYASIFCFLFFMFGFCLGAYPDFSVGMIIGSPTGLSMLYEFQYAMAFDAGIGWSFLGNQGFTLHADLLWLNRDWLIINRNRIPVYLGIGVNFSGLKNLGLRVPVGVIFPISINRNKNRLDIFVEAALIVNAVPSFSFVPPGIGLGIRYSF